MNIQTRIKLNKYQPRPYQKPILDALNRGYKKVLAILPRRGGKDLTAYAGWCVLKLIEKPCVIYYVFPTYAQGKKVLWDSITNTGERIIDYIPEELIESKNSQEMKIRLKNGSLFQIVGSDNFDSLMGTNPQGVVFSEYALQDPRAYQYIRPILTANNGWALFISTPRGKNHLWELYQIAKESENWFCYKLSIEDTQHISLHEIEKEKAEGIMSDDLIQQEYYCSFEMGVEGAYYAKYLDKMRIKGQIGQVPWEPGFKVNTVWDLGVRDSTCIIFFSVIGQTIRIIDCYENSKLGLDHYVNILKQKERDLGYVYGKHIAPHDIKVREFGSGMTRWEKAKQLGITFTIAPDLSIEDGIESVRSTLNKVWIDEKNCSILLKALENYRQEFDVKRKVYKSFPLHDWSSHFCFTGDTKILTRSGMRQIMLIEDGDEVLTLEGWKKCTKAVMTQKNAKLVEVTFVGGMKVKCTPDHLFLTTRGWKSSKSLQRCTKIRSSLTNSLNILMENCIVYGQMRSIFLRAEKDCIERCGKKLSDQYLKIATYITEIMIPLTTISGILNVYQKQSILNFLDRITKDSQALLGIKQPNGIDPKKEDYGIKDWLKEHKIGRNGKDEQGSAFCVNQSLRDLYVEMGMNKNFATQTVKHLTIASVKSLDEQADVWDITVPGIGHFSLQNGAIVHNSDCMRYLCISLPKTRDGSSAEDINKRYMEAVYGDQYGFPKAFKNPQEY